jgi:hypothetical protein
MDVHVPYGITLALRLRGVDVLTAQDDDAVRLPDDQLLNRATELGRVLFSQDKDLPREAKHRQKTGLSFAGVVYAPQIGLSFGRCIDDLELIAKCTEPHEWLNRLEYLPL